MIKKNHCICPDAGGRWFHTECRKDYVRRSALVDGLQPMSTQQHLAIGSVQQSSAYRTPVTSAPSGNGSVIAGGNGTSSSSSSSSSSASAFSSSLAPVSSSPTFATGSELSVVPVKRRLDFEGDADYEQDGNFNSDKWTDEQW